MAIRNEILSVKWKATVYQNNSAAFRFSCSKPKIGCTCTFHVHFISFLVQRSFRELSKTTLTPLYYALVRPHLGYAMEANAPTLMADINQLERVQRLATRLVTGLRHVPYEDRLRQLNLFSLKRRRLRADLILACKIFKGEVDLNPSEFYLRPPRAGLRGHTYRLL